MAAYQLGESYAASVGVPVRAFSVVLVLLSSLLAACVTAFAGPISFVGIAVPHLVKHTLGSAKPLRVLPGCALGGAAFCLFCDLLARSLFAPTELSISSVTAVFGAPVVIWLLCAATAGGHGMSCCETQKSRRRLRCAAAAGHCSCMPSAAKFWRSSVRTVRANPPFIKTLAGQLAAQGGAVLLDGQDLTAYTPNARARKLALMLPHTARTELTSCFEVAAAGRYPYTGRLGILSDADRQQVHDALCLVRAEELENRDFARISDGQRQRVLLARAVCQQPEILLLDEPTSFLDVKGKAELMDILQVLAHEKNVAVIVTLHELELAQKAGRRRSLRCAVRRVRCAGTAGRLCTGQYLCAV